MTPDNFDAKAREIADTLAKEHSDGSEAFVTDGFVYHADLVFSVAQALRDADQAGYRRGLRESMKLVLQANDVTCDKVLSLLKKDTQ